MEFNGNIAVAGSGASCQPWIDINNPPFDFGGMAELTEKDKFCRIRPGKVQQKPSCIVEIAISYDVERDCNIPYCSKY